MADEKEFAKGLEDVIAGESSICDVDGKNGKLIYRGYDIHDLAQNVTFEEVIYLLWNKDLPTAGELKSLNADLDANRALPEPALALLRQFPQKATAMDALRTATSLLGLYDPDQGDESVDANRRKALRVTARMGTMVAALHRLSQGEEPIPPKPGLSTAASFLHQLTGKEPSATEAHALDVALTLHADHELNASTFAARVTVATLTDMYSGVTSAVGTLAGPLHGGANVNVMHLLEKIGTPDRADQVVTEMLAAGRRFPASGTASTALWIPAPYPCARCPGSWPRSATTPNGMRSARKSRRPPTRLWLPKARRRSRPTWTSSPPRCITS